MGRILQSSQEKSSLDAWHGGRGKLNRVRLLEGDFTGP